MENVQDRQTMYAMYRPQKRYLTLTEKRYFSNVFNKISFFLSQPTKFLVRQGLKKGCKVDTTFLTIKAF